MLATQLLQSLASTQAPDHWVIRGGYCLARAGRPLHDLDLLYAPPDPFVAAPFEVAVSALVAELPATWRVLERSGVKDRGASLGASVVIGGRDTRLTVDLIDACRRPALPPLNVLARWRAVDPAEVIGDKLAWAFAHLLRPKAVLRSTDLEDIWAHLNVDKGDEVPVRRAFLSSCVLWVGDLANVPEARIATEPGSFERAVWAEGVLRKFLLLTDDEAAFFAGVGDLSRALEHRWLRGDVSIRWTFERLVQYLGYTSTYEGTEHVVPRLGVSAVALAHHLYNRARSVVLVRKGAVS